MSRFDAVLKELYEESYENSKHYKRKSWTIIDHQVPAVEYGESPSAVLRLAFLFDGTVFVEKVEIFDVSVKIRFNLSPQIKEIDHTKTNTNWFQ